MAIYLTCPTCYHRQSAKNKICKGCNRSIPRTALRYSLEVRDRQGKKILKTLGVCGYAYACEQHTELIRSITEGTYGKKKLTWGGLAEAYLSKLEKEGRTLRYIKATRLYLSRFSAAWGGGTHISEITHTMVREVRADLRGTGKGIASCNRHIAAVKAAWHHSVDNGHDPFKGLHAYNETEHLETRYLTEEQRTNLLVAALEVSQQLYEILIVALGTGLRKMNVLRLHRSQVDFDQGIIRVVQKRGRPLEIPMRPSVAAALSRAVSESDSEWFFPNPKTGRPYQEDWKKPWLKAAKLAGLPKDFTFHDLRHDFGSSVYNDTADIRLAQKLLGHTQLSTTLRYADVRLGRLRELSDRLDNLPISGTMPAAPTPVPTIFVTDRYDSDDF